MTERLHLRSAGAGGQNMPTRNATFRQSQVTRAIKGVVAAGVSIRQVEVETDGRIVIVASDGEESQAEDLTPLEKWKANHGAS